jgi:hypothetical protein
MPSYLAVRVLLVICIQYVVLLAVPSAFSHPGGLDGYGCHYDRQHGGYHCHSGSLAAKAFKSQAEMLAALKGGSPIAKPSEAAKPRSGLSKAITGVEAIEQICIREHRTQQIFCGEPVPLQK